MSKQILVIGGGDTFSTYEEYLNFLKNFEMDIEEYKVRKSDWKSKLGENLGREYEVIFPAMPNKTNAQYPEWKIWFEKIVDLLNDDLILIGHSLGGSFLIKYLSENKLTKKTTAVFLVSAVYDSDGDGNGLVSFSLPSEFDLQTDKVFLYHSKDDPIVPLTALEKIQSRLPSVKARIFENRGHFNQEEFPEIVEDILSLIK